MVSNSSWGGKKLNDSCLAASCAVSESADLHLCYLSDCIYDMDGVNHNQRNSLESQEWYDCDR